MRNRKLALVTSIGLSILLMSVGVSAQNTPIQQVLVWLEDGSSPAQSSPSVSGQVGFIDSAGEFTPLVEIPAQVSHVKPCGTSADGTLFAFFAGGDRGAIYLMRGQEAPVVMAEAADGLVCTGWNGVRFAPDGKRIAYLDYEADARQSEFADGTLHIVGTNDLATQFRAEKVTAFDVNNSGAAWVSFFVNERGEADEAIIFWWEDGIERELVTLAPDEGCRYTSSSLGIAPDGNLLIVLGHRCRSGDTRTSWQVYSVDKATSSAILAEADFQAGQFAPYARTNNVIFSPEGNMAYFTVPDGITANTVGLRAFTPTDMVTASVIDQQAVMATFGSSANTAPVLSADGRWLAVAMTTPNNENSVNVIDLTNGGEIHHVYAPNSRDDTIQAMQFSADGASLYIISGTGDARTGEYKLTHVNLSDGTNATLKRGRLAPVLAVGNDSLAMMEYLSVADTQPPYLNLVVLDPTTNEIATLLEGATITDNRVTEQRFAYPLAWR